VARKPPSNDCVELSRLIGKGAESLVFLGTILGKRVVVKVRVSKPYRNPLFDEEFRRSRTRIEAKVMLDLRRNGVNVPFLYFFDTKNYVIVMEYVDGVKMIDVINTLDDPAIKKYAEKLGMQVGRMHSLEIYHGDLTLGNVLLTRDDKLYLIDFGLAGYSKDVEEYAIDLHLLRRNLNAVIPEKSELFFKSFLKGYEKSFEKDLGEVLRKLEEIRLRGRYIEERLKKKIRREKYVE